MKARVSSDSTLERDTHSKAILNRDSQDYQRRISQKKVEQSKTTELESLKLEVSQLKSLVAQLCLVVSKS